MIFSKWNAQLMTKIANREGHPSCVVSFVDSAPEKRGWAVEPGPKRQSGHALLAIWPTR